MGQVIIEGGLDRQRRVYIWTLNNRSNQPVTALQVPHYRGVLFTSPEGWDFEITNRNDLGMKNEPGVITARSQEGFAIRPGRSAMFTLTFAPENVTAPGKGMATVTFADGTRETIPGIEIPWHIPWFGRYGPLVGFGAIFAVFLLAQALRGRRRKQPSDPAGL